MNAEKKDQGRSCKPFKFDLALSVLSAFICVLFFCAVCPAQIHPHSFSPRMLSGSTNLWMRADAITGLSDGDKIATWPDSGPGAHDGIQGNATYQPTYKSGIQNGKPIVRFSVTDLTLAGSFTITNDISVFAVYSVTACGDGVVFACNAISGSPSWEFCRAGIYNVNFPGVWVISTFGTLTTGVFHSMSFTRAGVGTAQYWHDGSTIATIDNGYSFTDGAPKIVGARTDSHQMSMAGDLSELVLYDRGLSTADRQRVERYLMRKWGL